MRAFIAVAAVLLLLVLVSGAAAIRATPKAKATSVGGGSSYSTNWYAGMMIPVIANATLSSDVYVPKPKTDNETFPLIIFPNSWDTPQIEYIVPAKKFAEKGYVAWEYETRGWYSSTGEIDTAGPLDRSDVSSVIDHIATFADVFHIDMSRIAFAGISYGAGISLMAAGHDSRVTTAVAMSGWGNLFGGLDYERTPSYHIQDLADLSQRAGVTNASLLQTVKNLLSHTNMPEVDKFADDRSPEKLFMDSYKERQVPIMMSSNFGDNLFFPQAVLDFFMALEVPKRMIFNNGGHAEAEASGNLGLKNYVWENTNNWIDYWIKGIDTGIMDTPLIRMQHGPTVFVDTFEGFSTYPDANKTENYKRFFNPRGAGKYGTLSIDIENATVTDLISYTAEPPLVYGDPTKVAFGKKPVMYNLSDASRETSVVYYAETLATDTAFCGMPALQLALAPTSTTSQIFTYLYDVHPDGSAEVLSNGMHTHWSNDGPALQSDLIKMRGFCRTIVAGHRIAIGMVLAQDRYLSANKSPDFKNGLSFSAAPSVFVMPVLKN